MNLLNISEQVLLFASSFGILQGILLAALLYFHPKTDRSVTVFLAMYICAISIPIIMPVGQQLFSWQVIIFVEPFTLLIGPLLYLYVCSFKEKIRWKKVWPHFILFFLYLFIAYWLYTEVGMKYPRSSKVPVEVTKHPLSVFPVSVRLLQRLFYYFLAIRALKTYQRSITHLFSETSRINLRWVKWLINGYLCLTIIIIILYMMILKYPENFSLWVLTLGTFVSIYIYIATAKGVTQSTIWQVNPDMTRQEVEVEIKKAEKIAVPETTVQNHKLDNVVMKINAMMEMEKLYQEPELTLQDLANKLQCPSYQVSQAINEGMNKSFYDLINGYRVEEAKRLLLDTKNRNYTILSVGFEAGFNSKTTFNTVFKKFTGVTPTQYRDKTTAKLAQLMD